MNQIIGDLIKPNSLTTMVMVFFLERGGYGFHKRYCNLNKIHIKAEIHSNIYDHV